MGSACCVVLAEDNDSNSLLTSSLAAKMSRRASAQYRIASCHMKITRVACEMNRNEHTHMSIDQYVSPVHTHTHSLSLIHTRDWTLAEMDRTSRTCCSRVNCFARLIMSFLNSVVMVTTRPPNSPMPWMAAWMAAAATTAGPKGTKSYSAARVGGG